MDVSTGYFLAEMGANYLNLWLSGETLSNTPFDFEDFDGETHGEEGHHSRGNIPIFRKSSYTMFFSYSRPGFGFVTLERAVGPWQSH